MECWCDCPSCQGKLAEDSMRCVAESVNFATLGETGQMGAPVQAFGLPALTAQPPLPGAGEGEP